MWIYNAAKKLFKLVVKSFKLVVRLFKWSCQKLKKGFSFVYALIKEKWNNRKKKNDRDNN